MIARMILLVASLGLATAACHTTERRRPKPAPSATVRRSHPTRAWDVAVAGEVVGTVILFESAEVPELSIYVVRNTYSQDLGWIDGLGRAYRLLPHHREPAWAGTGTVAQGTARILESARCELVETALPDGTESAPDATSGASPIP